MRIQKRYFQIHTPLIFFQDIKNVNQDLKNRSFIIWQNTIGFAVYICLLDYYP